MEVFIDLKDRTAIIKDRRTENNLIVNDAFPIPQNKITPSLLYTIDRKIQSKRNKEEIDIIVQVQETIKTTYTNINFTKLIPIVSSNFINTQQPILTPIDSINMLNKSIEEVEVAKNKEKDTLKF